MLHITRSSLTLKQELSSAQGLLLDLTHLLSRLKGEENFAFHIGIFMKRIPDYKVISKDAADLKQLLRSVCSYETSRSDAIRIVEGAYYEVTALLDTVSQIQLPAKR